MSHEELTLNINGTRRTGMFPKGIRLLDALRCLGYTGTKEGCGEGDCGACSVVRGDKVGNSCLVYAKQAVGGKVGTGGGVGAGEPLSPAPDFPPEFGYNGIRIPLYLMRAGLDPAFLELVGNQDLHESSEF